MNIEINQISLTELLSTDTAREVAEVSFIDMKIFFDEFLSCVLNIKNNFHLIFMKLKVLG